MKYIIVQLVIVLLSSCAIRNDPKLNDSRQCSVVDAYVEHCIRSGSYKASISDLVRMSYLPEYSEIYSDKIGFLWNEKIRFSESKWIIVAKSKRDVLNLRTIAVPLGGGVGKESNYYFPSDSNIHACKKLIGE